MEQRSLNGTWVVDELREVKYGYKITAIHEIWNYKTVQYSKENNVDGLFSKFINKFLKIKQEASGTRRRLQMNKGGVHTSNPMTALKASLWTR